MCGIAGIVNRRGPKTDAELLRRMIGMVVHRGPDDTGYFRDDIVGLAHARLSIIDLEGGGQPMSNEDGTIWITFNGEIFNYVELREDLVRKGHRFSTRSDTEAILHLFEEMGERCGPRFLPRRYSGGSENSPRGTRSWSIGTHVANGLTGRLHRVNWISRANLTMSNICGNYSQTRLAFGCARTCRLPPISVEDWTPPSRPRS